MMQRQDCSGLPGQVGLVELLAMDVVEEIQVGLAGEAGAGEGVGGAEKGELKVTRTII